MVNPVVLIAASGRHDLSGSPAGFGQPRYLAKQVRENEKTAVTIPEGGQVCIRVKEVRYDCSAQLIYKK
jgi:hypothetical protein